MAEDKASERVPSRHEVYLESLAEASANGNAPETPDAVKEGEVPAPYAVEDQDTSAFVGVSPEYRTYSGMFRQPFQAEEGPTVDAEKEAADRQLPLQNPNRGLHPSFSSEKEAAESKDETANVEEKNADTPQLPPVPPRGRRAAAAASTDDDDE